MLHRYCISTNLITIIIIIIIVMWHCLLMLLPASISVSETIFYILFSVYQMRCYCSYCCLIQRRFPPIRQNVDYVIILCLLLLSINLLFFICTVVKWLQLLHLSKLEGQSEFKSLVSTNKNSSCYLTSLEFSLVHFSHPRFLIDLFVVLKLWPVQ